jgi:hypothetical protein
MMRWGVTGLSLLLLAGCVTPVARSELLRREIGRSVAHATLVAGRPQASYDLPDGRRAFQWEDWSLVPRGGPRCTYTAFAVSTGHRNMLAAWHIVEIGNPAPGCA